MNNAPPLVQCLGLPQQKRKMSKAQECVDVLSLHFNGWPVSGEMLSLHYVARENDSVKGVVVRKVNTY